MLIYEVNIEIEPEIYDEYKKWIGPHAKEVASHKGFQKVELFETMSETGKVVFVTHYWVDTKENLDFYLKEYAPALKAEAADKFEDKINGIRRVLNLIY